MEVVPTCEVELGGQDEGDFIGLLLEEVLVKDKQVCVDGLEDGMHEGIRTGGREQILGSMEAGQNARLQPHDLHVQDQVIWLPLLYISQHVLNVLDGGLIQKFLLKSDPLLFFVFIKLRLFLLLFRFFLGLVQNFIFHDQLALFPEVEVGVRGIVWTNVVELVLDGREADFHVGLDDAVEEIVDVFEGVLDPELGTHIVEDGVEVSEFDFDQDLGIIVESQEHEFEDRVVDVLGVGLDLAEPFDKFFNVLVRVHFQLHFLEKT